MAPPGVNSFYDYLDNIMTTGSSCYLSSSKLSVIGSLSPSSFKPSFGPLSPSTYSIGLSVIHSDHDYVIKPAQVTCQSRSDVAEKLSPADDESNCVGDAMLSSAADFGNLADDNMTGSDFLQDLDNIDFSLADLDPCSDMTMEDSFQDFIDSAIDKSVQPFFGADMDGEAPQPHNTVIYNKEEFLHRLGLTPTPTPDVQAHLVSPNSEPSHPTLHSSPFTSDLIPTKKGSCSCSETTSCVVYSTAHSQHIVQTCSSTVKSSNPLHKGVNLQLYSHEPMTPLTIDTSFTDLPETFHIDLDNSTHSDDETDMCTEDSETVEFLKWLHDDPDHDKDINNNNSAPVVSPVSSDNRIPESVDFESFVNLEDLASADSISLPTPQSVDSQTSPQSPQDKTHPHLRFSFIPESHYTSKNLKTDSLSSGSPYTIQNSPFHAVSDYCSTQKWPSSAHTSPSASPSSISSTDYMWVSSTESQQLSLLSLFSDENAPALLQSECSLPEIRFI
ncbi:uncharacterized protein LOC131933345 [Physella acuta]|uniref:uncharacterized protein LOC131933345 n=1 Tax=Physella acuta TaxID=109671 RepID=UPI0027DDCECB|nr:uncharacterized protein LOC131933345 [Physella acuta]